ncbi:MAG: hypothetical protein M5R40_06225 [Anaerolineae bacterium]|nr:hypothetical protein [Anaerolineae bacterium]
MTHSSDQTAAPLPLDEFKRLVETQLQEREAESQKASFPEDEAAGKRASGWRLRSLDAAARGGL